MIWAWFLEKSHTNCGGETSLRPFYKKSKLSISLDQQSSMLYSLFVYQNILKLKCCALGFTLYKALFFFFFLKKKRSGTSLPATFSTWSLKENISRKIFHKNISVNWLNFIDWFLFLLEILGNICALKLSIIQSVTS